MTTGSMLEQASELERAFISGLFLAANLNRDIDVVNTLFDIGPERIFGIPRHQEVVRALRESYQDEGGVPGVADPVKVYRHLRSGVFDDFEGLSTYLSDYPFPASDLAGTLQDVKEAYTRRQLALIGSDLQARSSAVAPVDEVIQGTLSSLLLLRDTQMVRGGSTAVHYRDGLQEAIRAIEDALERRNAGIPIEVARCGIGFLDEILHGGLRPGTLTVLAARPSVGKSAFGTQWLFNAVTSMQDPEAWGALVIMEMSLQEVIYRDLAHETDIFSSKMWQGTVTESELAIIREAARRLGDARNILTHERVSTVDDCISMLHGDIMRMRRKPTKIVVDYLQLLKLESVSGVNINTSKAIGQITRKLKLFAKDMDVPVLILSQLNREVENRQDRRPQISDLRESGDIEQDCDNIIFLWPKKPLSTEEKDEPTRVVGVSVDKHRNGGLGSGEMIFHKAHTHFEALTGTRSTDDNDPPLSKVVTQRLVDCDEEG